MKLFKLESYKIFLFSLDKNLEFYFFRCWQRNGVFATNINVLIPISLHPDGLNLGYFKLRLFDLTEFIV